MSRKPIVALPSDRTIIDHHFYHKVGEKYVLPLIDLMGANPWLIPALGQKLDYDAILESVDGLLLTGGYSNIEPHRYGATVTHESSLIDPLRDKTNLAFIRKALEQGVPILGICRGIQELNVARGGTLHQQVHLVSGLLDHRWDDNRPFDEQYGPAHDVNLQPGGVLASISTSEVQVVNSLHEQGIDQLGEGLVVEAIAPDGLIEAVRVQDSKAFAFAAQWHPEWHFQDSVFYRSIFEAFGEACLNRAKGRTPV